MVFFFLFSTKLFLLFSFLCHAFIQRRDVCTTQRLYVAFSLSGRWLKVGWGDAAVVDELCEETELDGIIACQRYSV
jgi:hypothetical protein